MMFETITQSELIEIDGGVKPGYIVSGIVCGLGALTASGPLVVGLGIAAGIQVVAGIVGWKFKGESRKNIFSAFFVICDMKIRWDINGEQKMSKKRMCSISMLIVCLIGVCVLCVIGAEKESILFLPLICYFVYAAYTDKKNETTKFDKIMSLGLFCISLLGVTFFLNFIICFFIFIANRNGFNPFIF